jgi:hypothetical protein
MIGIAGSLWERRVILCLLANGNVASDGASFMEPGAGSRMS